MNVWDYETGVQLAPVLTGQRGYIPPTDYPGVRVFAVSTGPDFAAATVAFPSETLMGAIVDAGLTADVSEAWPTYAHPYVGERHRHFDPIKGHYHASLMTPGGAPNYWVRAGDSARPRFRSWGRVRSLDSRRPDCCRGAC